eukprot:TRINITY_DN10008_c0_g1_i1.p1 TRINITY_DN10008_c0_g1~~TRINITY_DN10008_c0_g1_i1.p1  ORF type:complete len:221 (+),score=23.21 TRINITY_DN10008_c0_g1_i1:42-704(+)
MHPSPAVDHRSMTRRSSSFEKMVYTIIMMTMVVFFVSPPQSCSGFVANRIQYAAEGCQTEVYRDYFIDGCTVHNHSWVVSYCNVGNTWQISECDTNTCKYASCHNATITTQGVCNNQTNTYVTCPDFYPSLPSTQVMMKHFYDYNTCRTNPVPSYGRSWSVQNCVESDDGGYEHYSCSSGSPTVSLCKDASCSQCGSSTSLPATCTSQAPNDWFLYKCGN